MSKIVSPVKPPAGDIDPNIANAVAILHGMLIALIPAFALFGPAKYSWLATVIVIGFFANWEMDPDRMCYLTRLENRYRGIKDKNSGPGYLYENFGKQYFPTLDPPAFYRRVHLMYLILAFIGLARYIDRCINCSVKKGILKSSRKK